MRQFSGFSKSVLPFDSLANTNVLGSQAPKLKRLMWKIIVKIVKCSTDVYKEREGFFLRLLRWYGSWEPKWDAGCEWMLRRLEAVHWRTWVLKIPHSSPDLFKWVVESSHQTMAYGKASTDATVVQSIFISITWFFPFLVYEGVNRMSLCSVVSAVSWRVCMKNPCWSITLPWKWTEK